MRAFKPLLIAGCKPSGARVVIVVTAPPVAALVAVRRSDVEERGGARSGPYGA
jgi:hypothetical protein